MAEKDSYRVLDLKALRCFWATAKHGSLTRAGIELGISEPAISKRIKALEGYLRTKLYESRGGRVSPTPSGQRVMSMAVELFDKLEEFERTLAGQEAAGSVVIAAEEPVQLYLLPEVVERFTREYPRVSLSLVSRTAAQTVELVRRNEADLGLVPEFSLPYELVFYPWRTFPAYLLCPIGHPLLQRGRATMRDLLNHANVMKYPLIVREIEAPEPQRIQEALRREGLPFNIAFAVGTMETVKQYVARGLGIGVVSGICLTEKDHRELQAVEIPKEFQGESTYGVVLRKDKYLTAALRGLLPMVGVGGISAA